jgi:ketosteroid isomerase-like protein
VALSPHIVRGRCAHSAARRADVAGWHSRLDVPILSLVTSPVTQAEIENFFHDYNDAFLATDGARIANFYRFPCLTLRGSGELLHMATVEDGRTLFENVARSYHDEGNRASTFAILDTVPVGGRSVLVTMDWELRRDDGSAIRGWRQSYNLIHSGDGWRIVLSTFHIE